MSIRPEISGFQLSGLTDLLRSGNMIALNELTAMLAEKGVAAEPVASILAKAITEGVPFANLTEEDDHHLTAAILLAGYRQVHSSTNSNFWSWQAVDSFVNGLKGRIDAEAWSILNYLNTGRPLFGTGFKERLYAYLSNSEIKVIRKSLPSFDLPQQWDSDDWEDVQIDDLEEDFAREFVGWLAEIDDKQQDLWYYLN